MRSFVLLTALAALPAGALAQPPRPDNPPPSTRPARMSIEVTSSAFATGDRIPPRFTCDGTQTAPPLAWSNIPKGTQSIAILVEDADAPSGAFTHWLVTGISPATTSLPVGGTLPSGAAAGKNDRGTIGYAGPCPPSGRHRYYFRVFALDTAIRAPRSKDEFVSEIDGHVLAEGQLIGTYQKITPP